MPSLLRGATCRWRREVFHCLQLTQIFRNSRSLCTIPLQIPSLMPLEMRKVQGRTYFLGFPEIRAGWALFTLIHRKLPGGSSVRWERSPVGGYGL